MRTWGSTPKDHRQQLPPPLGACPAAAAAPLGAGGAGGAGGSTGPRVPGKHGGWMVDDYIYIYTYTHTYIHIYIYIFICIDNTVSHGLVMILFSDYIESWFSDDG